MKKGRISLIYFLRSPGIVIGEIASLAIAGSVGASLPEWHVFKSSWFTALVLLTALSLAIVIHDRIRFLLRSGPTPRLLGSTLLHAGILSVILAGAVRALFASEAVVDLMEGETLPPVAAAWSGQFPGLFAQPFQLEQPVTLHTVRNRRYPDGSLRDLKVTLSAGELTANHDLNLPGGRLFLSTDFSPAALLEWKPGKSEATLLDSQSRTGTSDGPEGQRAYLRAFGDRSDTLEVRVMRQNGLLFAGNLHVGGTVTLPGGQTLTLHGMPLWVRLHGSHDTSPWLVYLGFILILAGSVLLFAPLAVPGVRLTSSPGRHPCPSPPVPCATFILALAFLSVSCARPSTAEARRLVERYNSVVSEAYRRGDVRLIDPVVGLNEGKKLTGLIGVRIDQGLTLDSQMLALDITDVIRGGETLRVRTREKWHYCDRKIGTGEQVGEASSDSYEMEYAFIRSNKDWMVDSIQFVTPPVVGRKAMTWAVTHGKGETK